MDEDKIERKLDAILYADVFGYSRLTEQDEVGTLRILGESLDAIIALVESHGGQVLHLAGDAVLADFASVVNALTCAVDIQGDLKLRNERRPEERKLKFRIGLNLGDVIVDRQEIYGDGVNVAARLQSIAEPGGICISRAAFEQVKGKINLGYECLGEQKLKNIAEPVCAYRVLLDPDAAGKIIGERRPQRRRRPSAVVTITGAMIVAMSLTAIWQGYLPPFFIEGAFEELEVPSPQVKPSIAVLPFKNLSAEAAEQYFSDGVTDDIITDLSRFRDLLVIAGNTMFTYKSKAVNVRDVSRELGVRYVLEGSIRRSGEKVRVNVQLIDGTTGHHLWSERLVRDLDDLFALQDEIVSTIVATLATRVDAVERERVMRKDTASLAAYDYVLRGREYRSQTTRTTNLEARKLFKQAIALDPRYSSAYVALGWCYFDTFLYGWTQSPSRALEQAHELARKALGLDESNYAAHRLLGSVYIKWMQYDLAISELERALELNPNDADSYDALGSALLYAGQSDAAIEAIQTAFRFNPDARPSSFIDLGLAYFLTGRYDDAIAVLEKGAGRNPNLVFHYVVLAAAHAEAGHSEDAERAAHTVLRLHPFFEVDSFGTGFRNPADRQRIAKALRRAGLK